MKKLVPAFAALALTTACVMPPKDVTDADLAAYDAAVASIGCDLLSESDYLPVELQTGLTREKIIEIGQYKLSTEEVVGLEGGGVRLVTGACAPTAA